MNFVFRLCLLVTLLAIPQMTALGQPSRTTLVADNGQRSIDPDQDIGKASLSELIGQLDGPKYSIRENATKELIRRGSIAIRPLARSAVNASPERARRIKRCLESIGTSGNEAAFFRSIGVVQVLFGSNNELLSERINLLRVQWLAKRQLRVLERLETLGAEISPPLTSANQFMQSIADELASNIENKPISLIRKDASDKEKSALISKILTNSVDENRKLMFQEKAATNSRRIKTDNELIVEALKKRIEAQGGLQVFGENDSSGIEVTIGRKWIGTPNQLSLLRDVPKLQTLRFVKQKLDHLQMELVSDLSSLMFLEFENCDIDERALALLRLPRKVYKIGLVNQTVNVSTIDRLMDAGSVTALRFDNCKFSKTAWSKLFRVKSIRRLELGHCNLDRDTFMRIKNMKTLGILNLDSCKFDTDAYRDLVSARNSDLRIEFAPSAFLGVRDFSQLAGGQTVGCQISEVVEGSGAAKGGLQSMDILMAIDGKPIRIFEDLRLCISQYDVGDTIKIDVRRGDKDLKFDVTLGKPNVDVR